MGSNCPIYGEHESRYPCVNRVHVGNDHVDFKYQFGKLSNVRYKEYIENTSSSKEIVTDTSKNLIGKSTKNQDMHDVRILLTMKSGGFEISTSWEKERRMIGLGKKCYGELKDDSNVFYNHIDLEFEEAVYPIRVCIHEWYSGGCITKLLTQNSEDNRWDVLWTRQRNIVSCEQVHFSPPLQSCNFKTKKLRIMLMCTVWDYYTCVDSVILIGTSKLILPKNSEQSLTDMFKSINSCQTIDKAPAAYNCICWDINCLQKNFSKYCTIYKSRSDLHLNYAQITKDIKLTSEESEEHTSCSFSRLPDEVILKILKKLDIRSLCRMSTMNKHLNNLTRDGSLFKCLNLINMRNMHSMYIDDIILYFISRCEHLRQLDLTSSNVSFLHFKKFLESCDGRLTHLRLSNCRFVDSCALLEIANMCKNLRVLDLSCCYYHGDAFSYLENLEFLEVLNLKCTRITVASICKILRRNRRIRDLNLNNLPKDNPFGDSASPRYPFVDERNRLCLDSIAIQLKESCPDLEILDISGGLITSQGIDALAECKDLRKLHIQKMNNGLINRRSLRKLFSACQRLEEVNLSGLYGSSGEELTLCKNLKQAHLRPLPQNISAILRQCPKLEKIYVMCNDLNLVYLLKKEYPHVSFCI
ncbi:PREDICTED: F-box/LRR-repeat protein 4-like isoform X2 [Vollenhovia emeryi]|uniref:F-box/LRR-repeat protein 4-like isoform X2 n=1 Tax=Vollenhovia emeryi TaxID=411798 RepID=UPI0005F38EE1|nr:PREDICTED: F-box/LRR-repeat protein 4-like isoform X2 [Vollenhovia emeryi]